MLVLSRKIHEAINVGNDIKIVVLEATNHRVRLGIEAPKDVRIMREEIDNDEKPVDVVPALPE